MHWSLRRFKYLFRLNWNISKEIPVVMINVSWSEKAKTIRSTLVEVFPNFWNTKTIMIKTLKTVPGKNNAGAATFLRLDIHQAKLAIHSGNVVDVELIVISSIVSITMVGTIFKSNGVSINQSVWHLDPYWTPSQVFNIYFAV